MISGFSGIQISGTGGVVSLIKISGICKSGIEISGVISLGGGGSCGGLFVLVGILLPERWGLCE